MRILMITHFVPFPPRGGALQRNYNLLRQIAKENEIHLITLTQKALLPTAEQLNDSINVVAKYCKSVTVFQIPTDRSKILWYLLLFFNLFSLAPYSVWRFRSRAMRNEVKKQLAKNQYDVIHIDTIDLALYIKCAPHVPKVLNHHNIESALLLRRAAKGQNILAKWYIYLQGWKLKKYERKMLQHIDMNVTVSELDGILLKKHCPGAKFTTISNGVDTEYFRPLDVQVNTRSIVFVASLDWYPNLDAVEYLTQAIWPILKREIPGIEMNLVGGPPPEAIVKFGRKDSAFKVHGFVEDVRPYMAAAAVYVVPIRVGGGTRLKILDAMAMGKAIVSTSIGCEGLEVNDGTDIVIADGPEEFVASTAELLRNHDLRKRLGVNARKTVERIYSWDKIGPALESVYRNLATGNR